MHHFIAFIGNGHGALSHRRRLGGVGGHLINGMGHLLNRPGGFGDLLGLMLRGFGQLHRGGLGILHRTRHLASGQVDGRHQLTQLINRIVNRVSNGAGEIFRDRSGYGQIAVGQVRDLIQQTHDRVLVTLVFLGGFT